MEKKRMMPASYWNSHSHHVKNLVQEGIVSMSCGSGALLLHRMLKSHRMLKKRPVGVIQVKKTIRQNQNYNSLFYMKAPCDLMTKHG